MIIRIDIKSALKSAKKSAADLSRDLGINYEMLNRYLNGRAKMPPAVEESISKKLDQWNEPKKP